MEQNGYKDLMVWKKGMDLVEIVYKITFGLPREEFLGLTKQIRNAAVSIPSNISEGWARNSPKSFIQFLNVARGSLSEIATQLEIARRLKYFDSEKSQIFEIIDQLGRMLNALIASIRRSIK